MTRDKAGQAFVPGFLAAASSTALRTEGNLPGGPGLFDIDRMRTGLERTPEQAAFPCGRCVGDGAAGAAGLCRDCAEPAGLCPFCGGTKPADQSCVCVDNDCE